MELKGVRVGFAITGSFCTFEKIIPQIENLIKEGAEVLPILSTNAANIDTRFGTAKDFKEKLVQITGKQIVETLVQAEPVGPNNLVDIIIVAPCTGNSLAKLANAVTDTAVLMVVKSHVRNNKPVVLGISTNDGLGGNSRNLGVLLNTKNYYFVPFAQDDSIKKPKSLIFKTELIIPTLKEALDGKQIQPILS